MRKYYIAKPLPVTAEACTRGEYNNMRGWVVPDNEDASDDGYIIQSEGTKYTTWLTEHEFHRRYVLA